MPTDIAGIILLPGNQGAHCPGNGTGQDQEGNPIECCCEECDFMLDCFPEYIPGEQEEMVFPSFP